MKKLPHLKIETLERVAYIIAILGFPLLLLSTIAVLVQLRDVRRIAESQNNIQLSILFLRDSNTAIIKTIEDNASDHQTKILKTNGGKFDPTQLDNYLGDFETIDLVYSEGFLTMDQLCISFSYYVNATVKNEEIQKYLADNSDYFGGLADLASVVAKSSNKSCH